MKTLLTNLLKEKNKVDFILVLLNLGGKTFW